MDKLIIIIKKEWAEVFKNKIVMMSVVFMPLLFAAMPLFILNGVAQTGDVSSVFNGIDEIPESFLALCGGITGIDCAYYFIASQFLILFLIMPVIIPVTIASYSIVGEKTTHTLEPLLATPISTWELLGGKALAAVIPALGATWLVYGIFVAGAITITGSSALPTLFFAPLWLVAIFVLSPLLSLAAVSAAVMVSSRVNDPRVAEQLSALVILPVIGIFMAQTYGMIQLNQTLIVWFSLIVFLVDVVMLYFAVQLFQRETILTRWK